jgi:signal transduction histidine kinase
MGLALALESGRTPTLAEARVLRPLAAFGLIHGTHEWLESYLLQGESLGTILPDWLPIVRLALLILSFASLLLFAVETFRLLPRRSKLRGRLPALIFIAYSLGIVLGGMLSYRGAEIPWQDLVDAMARYFLAAPAAMLAGLALRWQSENAFKSGQRPLGISLSITDLGFELYSITQLFVPSLEIFPASFLNQEVFLSFTGVPIQVIRTAVAILITLSILRATQEVEKERQRQLLATQQERLEALEQIQKETSNREALRLELLRHIVQAQEDERARIARELHDDTAQVLSAFSLEVGTLRDQLKKRSPLMVFVERLQDLSYQVSQSLYRIMRDLRPSELDDLGLLAALKNISNQDCAAKGLDCTLEINGTPRRLDTLIETVLFRVAQEGLSNIIRHADAQKARLCLSYKKDLVGLWISDQGRGFDTQEDFHPPRGWGLAGMRERVESVGGKLNIQSAKGQGTTIEVMIPLREVVIADEEQI